MNAVTPTPPAPDSAPDGPFIEELVRQLRALDEYGRYDEWTPARLLSPYIHGTERPRPAPIIGDPIARLKAFYNAIAAQVERQSGLITLPLVFVNYQGSGRALVIVGRLVVLDRAVQDVQRFGFKNLFKLQEEGEKALRGALALIGDHPAVASL